MLDALPTRTAVQLRQRLRPEGRLDYAGADLRMQLDSLAALRRTAACAKEPETVAWIVDHLRPGEVLFDLGANVGAYSLVAASVAGDHGKVVAVEPSAATFASLCANVRLNDLGERIVPLQCALGDSTRLGSFHYSSPDAGSALHRLAPAGVQDPDSETAGSQTVPVFRLDELAALLGLPRPHLLKVDVDGPELAVLHGAGDLLASPDLRTVLVEIDERDSDKDGADIVRLLADHGLRESARHPRGTPGLFNVVFTR